MAHFAKVENGIVVDSVVAEQEHIDSLEGVWIQTSYNTQGGVHTNGGTPLRKNYAGIGYTYDRQRDAFISPKPYESWILNEDTCLWEAPVPAPTDRPYEWDEKTASWVGDQGGV